MNIPGVTITLAADHGGRPYGIAGFGVDSAEAALPRLDELVHGIRQAGVDVVAIEKDNDQIPANLQAALLAKETQAQLTCLVPIDESKQRIVLDSIRFRSFVRAVLDQKEKAVFGALPGMCDVYITTCPPYYLCRDEYSPFVDGSQESLEIWFFVRSMQSGAPASGVALRFMDTHHWLILHLPSVDCSATRSLGMLSAVC